MPENSSRRRFIRNSVSAGIIAAHLNPAASAARVIGANDRINIGLIGCGKRAGGHMHFVKHASDAGANAAIVACCDVWKKQREAWPGRLKKLFTYTPPAHADYRKVLDVREMDAVIIATPAHQHCGQLLDAVKAGKHVYIEKPIAPLAGDMDALNKCCDAVNASNLVVQHGTQGSSHPATQAMGDFIRSGKLGKLFRIESSISNYIPYWNLYNGPAKESETDWKAFLYNKPYRPFDADQQAAWMGYHDFSSGPIGGWMSHFSNYVHHATGCEAPCTATAYGGIFCSSSDPRRTAPDNVTVVLEYAEGFLTHFETHFGSTIDNETTIFMFEKGSVRTRFGHWPGTPTYSNEGVSRGGHGEPEKIAIPEVPGYVHTANWLECIRNGQKPNADMALGYKQGVAVIMGDMAYSLGRKVRFDRESRKALPA